MHHSTTVFSPSGTPILDRTVGELVAERPSRSRVFQAHDIGFCCQGSRTLRQACELKGLAPEQMEEELAAEMAAGKAPVVNLATLALPELRARLVDIHHGFLRRELPRLHAMAERVAHVHGGHTPSLVELYNRFSTLAGELVLHVEQTERDLVQGLIAMEQGEAINASFATTLSSLEEDHATMEPALKGIRTLTHEFTPPPEACNTYRALFAGLEDLNADLQHHIHLENAVLFPTVRAELNEASAGDLSGVGQ